MFLTEINTSVSSTAVSGVKAEIKQTFHHMVSPLHLLVFPLVFYCGVVAAFNVTEFTRAYVSCAIGVENVRLAVLVGIMTRTLFTRCP